MGGTAVGRPVVLGVDFGGSKTAVAVAEPDEAPLAVDTLAVHSHDTAAETFDLGIAAARRALTEVPGAELVAVGACTFGIPRADGVDLAPNIDGWEQLAFGRRLEAAFPDVPIRIGTDVKVAAEAELARGALAGCDTGLYLNLGTGLAAALVVGGRVVRGAHGAAGEIGYTLRHPVGDWTAPRLEDVVSGKALALAAGDAIGEADVAALFGRAAVDARAHALCDRFCSELAHHLVNLAVALDPQRIVVGGGMVRAWQHLEPPLAAALRGAVPFPPELVLATFPFDAPLLGALAMASAAARDTTTASAQTVPEGALR